MTRQEKLAGVAVAVIIGAGLFNVYDPLDILGSGNFFITKAYPAGTETKFGNVLRSNSHYLTLATNGGEGVLECYYRDEEPETARIFVRDQNQKYEKGASVAEVYYGITANPIDNSIRDVPAGTLMWRSDKPAKDYSEDIKTAVWQASAGFRRHLHGFRKAGKPCRPVVHGDCHSEARPGLSKSESDHYFLSVGK